MISPTFEPSDIHSPRKKKGNLHFHLFICFSFGQRRIWPKFPIPGEVSGRRVWFLDLFTRRSESPCLSRLLIHWPVSLLLFLLLVLFAFVVSLFFCICFYLLYLFVCFCLCVRVYFNGSFVFYVYVCVFVCMYACVCVLMYVCVE